MIDWDDLETALNLLATPDKVERVLETVGAIQTLSRSNPKRAIYTLVGAVAWLTDERTCSMPGCPNSPFGAGSD